MVLFTRQESGPWALASRPNAYDTLSLKKTDSMCSYLQKIIYNFCVASAMDYFCTKSVITLSDSFQEYHELLQRCIKDDMGFKKGKPVAACVIYKCLLHWGVFEAERTTIFDFIIQNINTVLKVGILFYTLNCLHYMTMVYWP